MRVLVVNAGSSSLKLRLLDEHDALAGRADLGPVDDLSTDDLRRALDGLGAFDAVGHRVVHGGERFREPVVVDPDVRRRLADLTTLAPLHQPGSLAALDTGARQSSWRVTFSHLACWLTIESTMWVNAS